MAQPDSSSTFELQPRARPCANSDCFSVGSHASDSDSDTILIAHIPEADRSDSLIYPTNPYRFNANGKFVGIEVAKTP